ncbi:SNO glutamine amidotransferase [Trichodelitschia bisporula]|uniref:glutaminase n=1 Tax=Trichodelitschia bisporula TaxID=703511 RepID=A0A6G1HPH2_9PEZI|nr:SNO glutamine amidotransferase [Trichodelitschia bisporula]
MPRTRITIGVLALQGAFTEHIELLHAAAATIPDHDFSFPEVRTPAELARCDALILPGGESTTMSLVAQRSGLLEPLRDFVKAARKPTWGTCAGLILLSESANRTKAGGQDLIGGLDVRVSRNHFGRQVDSFEAGLHLDFIADPQRPFRSVFIRAPVVERLLPHVEGVQAEEASKEDTVVAPSVPVREEGRKALSDHVEVLARLPREARALGKSATAGELGEAGDIIAVRQGNVFGTSFHPELTGDARIHAWWLKGVVEAVEQRDRAS